LVIVSGCLYCEYALGDETKKELRCFIISVSVKSPAIALFFIVGIFGPANTFIAEKTPKVIRQISPTQTITYEIISPASAVYFTL